jgi:tetratricopeptide (TPR) repeat protein
MVLASYSLLGGVHLLGCGGGGASGGVAASTEAHLREAEALERKRRYDRARDRYQRAVDEAPDAASAGFAAHRFASALAFWGELPAARAMLEIAVERAPRRASAWHDLGILRAQLGDRRAAEDALRRAASLAPGDPRPPIALAALLLREGRCGEARAIYRRLLAADPPEKTRKLLGEALAYIDRLEAGGGCRRTP